MSEQIKELIEKQIAEVEDEIRRLPSWAAPLTVREQKLLYISNLLLRVVQNQQTQIESLEDQIERMASSVGYKL